MLFIEGAMDGKGNDADHQYNHRCKGRNAKQKSKHTIHGLHIGLCRTGVMENYKKKIFPATAGQGCRRLVQVGVPGIVI